MKPYHLTGRIWLTLNHETVLGDGKIQLLQNIQEMGSLTKAAEKMEMSYRKAWFSINQMNKTAEHPVVNLTRGGKDGGKAELTEYGLELLEAFLKQRTAFEDFLNSQNSE